ncbi:MAG: FG-GAP-like repeat-containing protein [Pirellulaceae bacterium]|nr:FG-GAP-like repeat-containing protein [Pirellulaceae bacterium]
MKMEPLVLRSSWVGYFAVLLIAFLISDCSAEKDFSIRVDWQTVQLSPHFFSEGATVGDFDRDGDLDIASGPWWYEGPDWKQKHQFYAQDAIDPHGYSNNFFAFTEDLNADGWDDILVYGFPGEDASWYENPRGANRFWPHHKVLEGLDNESPTFVDINGDGRREIVCSVDGFFGYAEVNRDDPALPWKFVRISDKSAGGKFTHGLGVGDVNGDGRLDLLEKNGWWEQPAGKAKLWKQHKVAFGEGHGSSQIFAYDVDGDRDHDVVCSLNAHGFGLAWFENLGSQQFKRHLIMGAKPSDNDYGICFSQLHAMQLADVDGDGLKDIVTGKRYWAHGPRGDVQSRHPAVVYWFQLQRDRAGESVRWIPRQIDDDSGVGMEVDVVDVNGDNLPDVLIGNKKGTHLHVQGRSKISASEGQRDLQIGIDDIARPTQQGEPDAAGLDPQEAAAAMTLPRGFRVQLAAGEPMIHQPIAMTFDHRGRLWIAEAYEYPIRAKEGQGKDKIVILEDTNLDGVFDNRKVFADKLNLISGLEVGFGGVWVGAAPYFMFIPDRDGDDQPDGEPEILLDGFDYRDTHETLNAFNWGPDGWLYGCHGVFNYSDVGKPGCDDSERMRLTCGVWRYHPVRHKFEAFARGTSNPWGVDFNEYGHAFMTACVIPHMYHMSQGGRYQRQGGQHLNSHTYDDIKTIADHAHFTGQVSDHAWWGRDQNANSQSIYDAGGGHAHCGAMIYLGDNWPHQYRNSIFMTNLLGNRINNDVLHRVGSGYVASHGHDFLFANDQWFRCINQRLAPDGSVYLIDWYDKQACHRDDKERWDRTNGRVYQVAYGEVKPRSVDLSKLSDGQLANLQLHENEWQVRVSRRILQERAAAKKLNHEAVRHVLLPILKDHPSVSRRLRATWVLHVCGLLHAEDRTFLLNAEGRKSEYLRAWAIQLDAEDGQADDLGKWIPLAAGDDSPLVRLYLASALQRLPLDDRWQIAKGLLQHADDAADQNVPLMIWYGVEPLVPHNVDRALALVTGSKIPVVRQFVYRRAAADPETRGPLLDLLKNTDDIGLQKQMVGEVAEALSRQGKLSMPVEWPALYSKLAQSSDDQLRDQALAISVRFGDASIFPILREIARNQEANASSRENALTALITGKDIELLPLLLEMLDDDMLRLKAIQAMAGYEDESIPVAILARYSTFSPREQATALATLSSHASFANRLIEAIADQTVKREHVTAYTIRQLLVLNDQALNKKIERVWGQIGQSTGDKRRRIESLKRQLSSDRLGESDLSHGRTLYEKSCAKCHLLFGEGSRIGPDITGSNRANLDYVLHNIIDPNALIGKDYQTTQMILTNGRVVMGLVKDETDSAVVLQTATEKLVVDKADIDERQLSKMSMMPEGQLDKMTVDQIRDLIAYLASPKQVTLPGTAPQYDDATRRVFGAIEGETMSVIDRTGGKSDPQEMVAFSDGNWSQDSHLWWIQAKPGDKLTLQFAAPRAIEYEIFLGLTKAVDYGIIKLTLNDQTLVEQLDLFHPTVVPTGPLRFGKHRLKEQGNRLQIEIVGVNPKADPSYMVGLDYLYLGSSEQEKNSAD